MARLRKLTIGCLHVGADPGHFGHAPQMYEEKQILRALRDKKNRKLIAELLLSGDIVEGLPSQ